MRLRVITAAAGLAALAGAALFVSLTSAPAAAGRGDHHCGYKSGSHCYSIPPSPPETTVPPPVTSGPPPETTSPPQSSAPPTSPPPQTSNPPESSAPPQTTPPPSSWTPQPSTIPSTPPTLPRTGTSYVIPLAAGGSLLLIGAGLLWATRWRRRTQ